MKLTPDAPPSRVTAIDAYRGLVMFLMMAEVLRLPRIARRFPDSPDAPERAAQTRATLTTCLVGSAYRRSSCSCW